MLKEKKYYEISSISKVCLLLEMLSTRKSWELAELCKAVGLPKTTVHRMLLTLEDNGYVVQEKQRGEYCLSYKLFSIGSRVLHHSNLVDIAKPFCQELLEAVNESVNLGVIAGSEMLIVDKHISMQNLRHESFLGTTFPLFKSASGKIFLAFADDNELDKAFRKIKESSSMMNPEKLMQEMGAEIEKIRITGLAYDYEEVYIGVRCIATPLFNFQNKLAATLSVSVPTVRLTNTSTVKNIEEQIIRAAQKISLRLGASPSCFSFKEAV